MAMSQALRECLCKVIEDMVVLFRQEGKECLKAEITAAPKLKEVNGITKYKGNPFTSITKQSMNLWDDILREFDAVAINLRKDNPQELFKALKNVTTKCGELTSLLAGIVVETGSYIPGPIGMVCSLCLSITCFATGNVLGGFMNLLGCIPCGKVVGKSGKFFASKLIPRMKAIFSKSGIMKYKPILTKTDFWKYQTVFQQTLIRETRNLHAALETLKESFTSQIGLKLNILG